MLHALKWTVFKTANLKDVSSIAGCHREGGYCDLLELK